MSVTVSLVPFFLIVAVGSTLSEITSSVVQGRQYAGKTSSSLLHLEAEDIQKIFNKKYETTILDRDVLIKTLKEHGATSVKVDGDKITCDCEEFSLVFEKTESNKPYSMQISYVSDKNLNEFVENIGAEYTANAQEISYNKIKERLADKSLEIYEEEIYDDNTIVLTVNLD